MNYYRLLLQPKQPHTSFQPYTPYVFMLIATTIWPVAWLYINENSINYVETLLIRGITCMFVNLPICLYASSSVTFDDKPKLGEDARGQLFWLIARSLCMVAHSLCFTLSQIFLPLPVVHTISCSGVLYIFIIDYYMYGTRINSRQAIGIALGFLGSVLAANGEYLRKLFDSDYKYETKFQNYATDDPLLIALFSFIFFLVMLLWGYGIVITKKTHANTFQINYILGLVLTVSGGIMYPYVDNKVTLSQYFTAFIATGLPLVFGQWLYIGSLTMTKDTGVLNMVNFWAIFVGFVTSYLRYGQVPNFIGIIGIGFVFVGVYKTIFNKDKPEANPSQ